jgi:hypothetical protein
MKENANILLYASNDFSSKLNTERIKYYACMFMSCHQKAGQNYIIRYMYLIAFS